MAHHAGFRPPAGGLEFRTLPLPEQPHAYRRSRPQARRHPDRQRWRVMLIDGIKILAADRGTVWQALNDPAFLQATLPDCKSLSASGDDSYSAVMVSAIGPVKATFRIQFRREVETPMQAYVLAGQGDAGVEIGRAHD